MKSVYLSLSFLASTMLCCNSNDSKENPVNESAKISQEMKQKPFVDSTHEFQRIDASHRYSLDSDTPKTLGNTESGMKEFDRRRNFVAASEFPIANPFVIPTAGNKDWAKWDEKYTDYVQKNAANPYLPIFKRIGSLIILKDMALLAGTTKEEKEKISFYTKELLDNGGGYNTAITYYCLSALKGVWPDELIKKYAKLSMTEMSHDRMTLSIKSDVAKMKALRTSGEAVDTTFISGLQKLLQQQMSYQDKLATL